MTDTTELPVIIDSHIHVPRKFVLRDEATSLFHRQIFEDKHCNKCELKPDRPTDMCRGCEAFVGDFKMVGKSHHEGYVRFSKGRPDLIDKALKKPLADHPTVDNRVIKKWKHEITWNDEEFPLYDYQEKSVEHFFDKKMGILKSQPRTGKTVISVNAICRLGLKAIVIAHQDDLIKQFLETFHNFTDTLDVEKFTGKKLVVQAKVAEDFKTCQVALCTYQTFLSAGGKELLKQIAPYFSVVVIDECHRASADAYLKTLEHFSPTYEMGLSATPIRKDGKDVGLTLHLGSIFYETTATALSPLMRVYETGIKPKRVPEQWVYIIKMLERDEKRNELIVKHAVSGIKAGRHVLIPLDFVNHIDTVVAMINHEFDEPVAVAFNGKVVAKKRKEVIAKLRSGEFKCMVARRSMLTGINIPRLDLLIQSLPSANHYNYEQEINRICTPMYDEHGNSIKPRPVVKYFIDDFPLSQHCFVIVSRAFKVVGVEFTEKSKPILQRIFSNGRYKNEPVVKHLDLNTEKPPAENKGAFGKTAFPNKKAKPQQRELDEIV